MPTRQQRQHVNASVMSRCQHANNNIENENSGDNDNKR